MFVLLCDVLQNVWKFCKLFKHTWEREAVVLTGKRFIGKSATIRIEEGEEKIGGILFKDLHYDL